MANFIKDSIQELEHVVWPTANESKKYMFYTVGTIVIMASILALFGYGLQGGLKGVRSQFPHAPITTETVSGESEFATEKDFEEALQKRKNIKEAQSGTTLTGKTNTGTGK